tara:strand:+ start:72 stop:404 length:333 start_codon:yes stop_codon:yes gene_type:complete
MKVLIFLLLIVSCGTYTPQPTIKHVLAVTSEGDTLLIPINRIRPNIYQTIYPSYGNFYDSYYYNGWRYNTNVYSNHKTYESNNNNTNNYKSEQKDISRIDVNESKVKMKN